MDGARTATAIHCVWVSRSGKDCSIRLNVRCVVQVEIWSVLRTENGNLLLQQMDWSVIEPLRKAVAFTVMRLRRHRADSSWIQRKGKKLQQNCQNIKN